MISGRKRHVAVDKLGLLLAVTAASADDGNAAPEVLWLLDDDKKFPRLEVVDADPKSENATVKGVAGGAGRSVLAGGGQASRGAGGLRQVAQALGGRDDLLDKIDAEFDRELFEIACEAVRRRVEPLTWEAFRLLAIGGLSGHEVAERLGMKPNTSFVARFRVQRLMREEIERLDRPINPSTRDGQPRGRGASPAVWATGAASGEGAAGAARPSGLATTLSPGFRPSRISA